jgi:excisionase family DNA binding protein
MTERLTLTVPEAAELLGISRGVAYEAARSGELPAILLGRRLLVPRHALLSLLNANETAANGLAGEKAEVSGRVPS